MSESEVSPFYDRAINAFFERTDSPNVKNMFFVYVHLCVCTIPFDVSDSEFGCGCGGRPV